MRVAGCGLRVSGLSIADLRFRIEKIDRLTSSNVGWVETRHLNVGFLRLRRTNLRKLSIRQNFITKGRNPTIHFDPNKILKPGQIRQFKLVVLYMALHISFICK